ncbi:uncharacterized protein KQ657_000064 [Scheffersomyces spartinae]|uniref:Uncharacterized protein n=1 Tax=Scheffersomyces spartinae TaxID=45513 RepID=A0A9P7VDX8_9ASCO|nr:uncharacterized protein KQ657_000064 [Scheffersomyces spartinae]KAG7196055.1 hypothetical protein KQ657_000064 [Scheffersomyces spartinae]
MDFEEQLEKAEKLSAPSLVGASLRSADDSAHQNYIHPEKSNPNKLAQCVAHSSVPTSIDKLTASLDNLINEGALLGSEENFDSYLDTNGNVIKSEFSKKPASHVDDKKAISELLEGIAPEKESDGTLPIPAPIANNSVSDSAVATIAVESDSSQKKPFYKQSGDFSTPNLSEYQLEHEITDHADLLANIQSHDPHRLPTDGSVSDSTDLKTPTNDSFRKLAVSSPASDTLSTSKRKQQNLSSLNHDSIHSPYFYTDSTPVTHSESVRSRSRSRSQNPPATPHAVTQPSAAAQERSRSRSSIRPHLARGDSYKLTHLEEPSKYELPADFTDETISVREDEVAASTKETLESSASTSRKVDNGDDEDDDDRRSRASRPTMGELIAAAEKELATQGTIQTQLLRDPSLVTTGDYTNYNVDTPVPNYSSDLATERLTSSVQYLRSISRSRSRQANVNVSKDDATLKELVAEGALISDDPYSTIDQLDSLVENVLTKDSAADQRASLTSNKKASLTNFKEDASLTNSKEDTSLTNSMEDANLTNSTEASLTNSKENASLTEANEDSSLTNSKEASLINSVDRESKPAADEESEELNNTALGDKAISKESQNKVDAEDLDIPGSFKSDEALDENPKQAHVEVTPEAEKALEKIKKEEDQPTSKSSKAEDTDDFDLENMEVNPEELRAHLESQPVYIYTSLAGGMQIMPRTNRLVTILNANQIKYELRDLGTDEAAKKIWRTYSKGKTLPGIVRGDDFIGNWQDIEEANEEYRLTELLYETF